MLPFLAYSKKKTRLHSALLFVVCDPQQSPVCLEGWIIGKLQIFKQFEVEQNHMKSLQFNLVHLLELVDVFAQKDVSTYSQPVHLPIQTRL